jgi:hypothetical protein
MSFAISSLTATPHGVTRSLVGAPQQRGRQLSARTGSISQFRLPVLPVVVLLDLLSNSTTPLESAAHSLPNVGC